MKPKRTASEFRRSRALAARLAEVVGRAAVGVATARRRLRPSDVSRKGVGDFVTTVDVRTEKALRRELAALLPDAGYLGEETAAADLDRERVWVVDPIDGTSNFARGLPHFAVSVALLEAGEPVLAVVHCQPEDAIYTAIRGAGAFRRSRRLRMRATRIDDAAVIGCQWHRGQQRMGFLARLQRSGSRIRTLGSTVTQLVDVAHGRLDGNVQQQGRLWDFAAAALVVTEAGGRFTDWRGRPVFPLEALDLGHTSTVAASPLAHGQILELLGGRVRVGGGGSPSSERP